MDKDTAIQNLLSISANETMRVLGYRFIAVLPSATNLANVSASTIGSTIMSNIKSYSSTRSGVAILYFNPSKKEFLERDFEEQFANGSIQTEYFDNKNVAKSEARNKYFAIVNDRYRTIKQLKITTKGFSVTNSAEVDKVLLVASTCGITVQRMVLTTFASSISLAKVMLDNLCANNSASMKIATFIKSSNANNSMNELIKIYNANAPNFNIINSQATDTIGDDYEENKEGYRSKLFSNIADPKNRLIQTTWKNYPEGTVFIAIISKDEFKQFASDYFTYCKPHSYIKFVPNDISYNIGNLERNEKSPQTKLIGQLLNHTTSDSKYVIAILRTKDGIAFHQLK